MYHRIAEVDFDPWELAVSPAKFEEQLEVLKEEYRVISVNDMITQLNAKSFLSKSICLTFDDGYRDNYFDAKPLLEKHQCSASFFIPTEYVGQKKQFWWDELHCVLLCSLKLPSSISLSISGELFSFKMEHDSELTEEQWNMQRSWVWPKKPPTQRCELYLALWERLKPLPFIEIQSALGDIRSWAGFTPPVHSEDFPITEQQLKDLVNHPFIDIGMHTVTHPALSFHSMEIQQGEILSSKQYLENCFNRPITTIAYPYGEYNSHTLTIAKENNLTAAFTTEERSITQTADPFRLGRFHVKNWNGEEFKMHLSKWIKSF